MSKHQEKKSAIDPYRPIADYALIGDCHSAALVSRTASIDWCCLPRFDSDSLFGRMLDWKQGGFCEIRPRGDDWQASREYCDATLVLVTTFRSGDGEAKVIDSFAMREGGHKHPYHQILRIVEGVRGSMELDVRIAPRFDFGALKPWLRDHGDCVFTAVGSNVGLVICGDMPLQFDGKYDLATTIQVEAEQRLRLSLQFAPPETLDDGPESIPDAKEIDARLQASIDWWRAWSKRVKGDDVHGPAMLRSAIVLKALTYAPTGAAIAAPTTSLPAGFDGDRAWDYRYSWVRDAAFTIDELIELGLEAEARRFRKFVERSAAGSAQQLQTLFSIDGKRRQAEFSLDHMDGYGGEWPVRIGNQAVHQLQLDIFGELLELSWRWHQHGHTPSDDYWRFVVELVDTVVDSWQDPDSGIWEMRGEPQHFVHSKVMAWAALHRGVCLAKDSGHDAPIERWEKVRDQIWQRVVERGYDEQRGIFVQAFGSKYLDAALLLLPRLGFIDYCDPRMLRTVDAIRDELDQGGLLQRYNNPDHIPGEEGAFLACSFWLTECLVRQQRRDEALELFDRACASANDLGLFAEQFDVKAGLLLGNFPQGLTHLSHISAMLALTR